MIPQDVIQRVMIAHDRAVKAVARWEVKIPGTRAKENAYERFANAEQKFESALVALVDEANKERR